MTPAPAPAPDPGSTLTPALPREGGRESSGRSATAAPESAPPEARFALNVVEDGEHRILLLRRAASAALGPGLWGLPAGHIEPGESPWDCAQRELREEIGTAHRLRLVKCLGPIRDRLYGGRYEVHLFHLRWEGGEVILNREHTAAAWVGAEDYRRYPVMDGIDEDLLYLGIWPRSVLNEDKLPPP